MFSNCTDNNAVRRGGNMDTVGQKTVPMFDQCVKIN